MLARSPVREEPSAHNSKGKESYAIGRTKLGMCDFRATIEERVLHLTGHHFDTAVHDGLEAGGVEIGHPNVANEALRLYNKKGEVGRGLGVVTWDEKRRIFLKKNSE